MHVGAFASVCVVVVFEMGGKPDSRIANQCTGVFQQAPGAVNEEKYFDMGMKNR